MAFASNKTYDCVLPDWASGSVWHFRREQTLDDIEASADLTIVASAEVDEVAQKKAIDAGEQYIPKVNFESKMSARRAMLYVMSRDVGGWEGDEFKLPDDYEDRTELRTKKGYPLHKLAGKVPPCTPEWIGKITSKDIIEITSRLNRLYAGRSPEEAKQFQAGAVELDEPGSAEVVPEEASEAGDSGQVASDKANGLDA